MTRDNEERIAPEKSSWFRICTRRRRRRPNVTDQHLTRRNSALTPYQIEYSTRCGCADRQNKADCHLLNGENYKKYKVFKITTKAMKHRVYPAFLLGKRTKDPEFISYQLRNFFRHLILNCIESCITLTRTPFPWTIRQAILRIERQIVLNLFCKFNNIAY